MSKAIVDPAEMRRFAADLHRFNTELAGVPCIGDSLRDLQAAAAVGAKAILVLTGKGKQTAAKGGLPPHTQTFADLDEAVKSITQ